MTSSSLSQQPALWLSFWFLTVIELLLVFHVSSRPLAWRSKLSPRIKFVTSFCCSTCSINNLVRRRFDFCRFSLFLFDNGSFLLPPMDQVCVVNEDKSSNDEGSSNPSNNAEESLPTEPLALLLRLETMLSRLEFPQRFVLSLLDSSSWAWSPVIEVEHVPAFDVRVDLLVCSSPLFRRLIDETQLSNPMVVLRRCGLLSALLLTVLYAYSAWDKDHNNRRKRKWKWGVGIWQTQSLVKSNSRSEQLFGEAWTHKTGLSLLQPVAVLYVQTVRVSGARIWNSGYSGIHN